MRPICIFLITSLFFSNFATEEEAYSFSRKRLDDIVFQESFRNIGFADAEADSIHYNISENLKALKKLYDMKSNFAVAKYLPYIPEKPEPLLLKDKDGRIYAKIRIFLGFNPQIMSIEEVFGFFYMKEDWKELDRVYIVLRTTNTQDPPYIQELRKYVNLTPKAKDPVAKADQSDSNADIKLEYYRMEQIPYKYLHEPLIQQEPDQSLTLHSNEAPLEFRNQRFIFANYKKNLKYCDVALRIFLENAETGREALYRKVINHRKPN